jgi:hypothetical protein
MHTVVRNYSGNGAKALGELLERRKEDVEKLMRSVPGLVSYSLIRTQDGAMSVSVCENKAGTDESVRLARDWIRENAGDLGLGAPTISEGPTILHTR